MLILCISVYYERSALPQSHHTHSHQPLFSKKDRKTDGETERERQTIGIGSRETESNSKAVIIIVDELAFPVATVCFQRLCVKSRTAESGGKQKSEALTGANSTTKDLKQPVSSAGLKTFSTSVSVFSTFTYLFVHPLSKINNYYRSLRCNCFYTSITNTIK